MEGGQLLNPALNVPLLVDFINLSPLPCPCPWLFPPFFLLSVCSSYHFVCENAGAGEPDRVPCVACVECRQEV